MGGEHNIPREKHGIFEHLIDEFWFLAKFEEFGFLEEIQTKVIFAVRFKVIFRFIFTFIILRFSVTRLLKSPVKLVPEGLNRQTIAFLNIKFEAKTASKSEHFHIVFDESSFVKQSTTDNRISSIDLHIFACIVICQSKIQHKLKNRSKSDLGSEHNIPREKHGIFLVKLRMRNMLLGSFKNFLGKGLLKFHRLFGFFIKRC